MLIITAIWFAYIGFRGFKTLGSDEGKTLGAVSYAGFLVLGHHLIEPIPFTYFLLGTVLGVSIVLAIICEEL